MNHSHHHDHGRSVQPRLELVRFEFTHPTAATVCVAGTFNHWAPEALLGLGEGRWLAETFLPAGTYEYRLVVDGQWIADPLARESVPNPFGGRNSLRKVGDSLEPAHLADAEHSPLNNPQAVG